MTMYQAFKSKQSPLVSAEWLSEAKSKSNGLPNLVVLDVSIPMPGEKRDCYAEFKEKHIPGARFLSLAECATTDTDNNYMLPSPEKFSEFMSKLGVTNSSKVVLYDANERKGMFSSPRGWYMLRVFGHIDVHVLNGGLLQWIASGHPTESGESLSVSETQYKATFNEKLVKSLDEVKNNISAKEWQLIDARSDNRFHGTAPEPRPGIKPGHIPGSSSLFWIKFLDEEKKVYKSAEELSAVCSESGVDFSKPTVATCGSGITASFIALTSHILGYYDVPIYDGAWVDWYQHAPDDLKEEVPTD